MNCQFYKNYCSSRFHEDEEECHMIMEKYYQVLFNKRTFYVCPGCEKTEEEDYRVFFHKHEEHLDMFSKSKKKIFKCTSYEEISIN